MHNLSDKLLSFFSRLRQTDDICISFLKFLLFVISTLTRQQVKATALNHVDEGISVWTSGAPCLLK